jgi:hypothetical protein
VAEIACVSKTETTAEKLIALARKTAAELADLANNPDRTLMRHICDLRAMRAHVDLGAVTPLAGGIAGSDAEQFRNLSPAYAINTAGETRRVLDALRSGPAYRGRYARFLADIVYRERCEFDEVMETVTTLGMGIVQSEDR